MARSTKPHEFASKRNAILAAARRLVLTIVEQRAPWLTEIVRHGIAEGVFTTPFSDQAGEIIMALLQGMGNAPARMLLSFADEGEQRRRVDCIVAAHAAFMDALERVLGAPSNCLYRADADVVMVWVAALQPARAAEGNVCINQSPRS